jgi:hypothetical protein
MEEPVDDVDSQYGGVYAYENSTPPPSHAQPVHKKPNVFNQLDDKVVYILLLIIFLLGFFVGKSFMQPVIIKTMGTV